MLDQAKCVLIYTHFVILAMSGRPERVRDDCTQQIQCVNVKCLMLAHRLRRWPNINPSFCQRVCLLRISDIKNLWT